MSRAYLSTPARLRTGSPPRVEKEQKRNVRPSRQQRYQGAHRNNCIHGLAPRTKVRASRQCRKTTPRQADAAGIRSTDLSCSPTLAGRRCNRQLATVSGHTKPNRISPHRRDRTAAPARKEQAVTPDMIALVRTQSFPRPWLANSHADAAKKRIGQGRHGKSRRRSRLLLPILGQVRPASTDWTRQETGP